MSQARTHELEGRKREEWVGEPGNMAHHKRGLTNWRGGRGRSRLVSLEMWHVTNEDSLTGGEEEGGASWWGWKSGKLQMGADSLEGRKREEEVGEVGKVGSYKWGLTNWRGGRGRSRLVSLEMWHITNEDSQPGGEEEGGAGW